MPVIPPSFYYPLGTLENPSDTHLWPLISVCAPPPRNYHSPLIWPLYRLDHHWFSSSCPFRPWLPKRPTLVCFFSWHFLFSLHLPLLFFPPFLLSQKIWVSILVFLTRERRHFLLRIFFIRKKKTTEILNLHLRARFDMMRKEIHPQYCQQEGKGLLFLMRIKATPHIMPNLFTVSNYEYFKTQWEGQSQKSLCWGLSHPLFP